MELTENQKMAINETERNLQIIACAGSGKTEVITRRIGKIISSGLAKPEEIVAFTFTNMAADSMLSRVESFLAEGDKNLVDNLDKMYIGTIHAFCYKVLTDYEDKFANFSILDSVKNYLFIKRYHRECGLVDWGLKLSYYNVKLFSQCIDKLVDDYKHQYDWDEKDKLVFNKYREILYSNSFFDYSMLILEAVEQLENNPQVRDYISTIKYLIVDEYQDVDDLQEKIVRIFSKAGANICVVGDDDQTIYQFRGSNVNNMINFSENYSDVHKIKLEDNFRSSEEIIDIAVNVISKNPQRLDKKMRSNLGSKGSVEGINGHTIKGQYEKIAQEIIDLNEYNSVAYKDIAILARKGKYIGQISSVLSEYEIPYIIASSEQFFEGAYFKLFFETFKLITELDKKEFIEFWGKYAGQEELSKGYRYLREIARMGGTAYTVELKTILLELVKIMGFLDQKNYDVQHRLDCINGLMIIFEDYDQIHKEHELSYRISGLLNFIEKDAIKEYKYHSFKQDAQNDENGVHIITAHKSKGLEFDYVFIPNLVEGEFPVTKRGGRTPWHILGSRYEKIKKKYLSGIEDERRLFYVAVTRARCKLFLYYFTGKPLSRFLKEASKSKHLDINILDLTRIVLSRSQENKIRARLKQNIMDLYHLGHKAAIMDLPEIEDASGGKLVELARRYKISIYDILDVGDDN